MKGMAMTHLVRSIHGSILCAGLLLAGCGGSIVAGPEDSLTVQQRFPITVEAQMANYQVPLNAARTDVDPRIETDLQQIASDYLANGSGSLALSATGNDRNVT